MARMIFDPRSQCRDKFMYDTREAAKRIRKQLADWHPEYEFSTYRCPHCGFYHVGRRREGNTAHADELAI